MPWVRFTADFDWKHNVRALTAYKAGMRQLVSQDCAAAAIAAGKAVASPAEPEAAAQSSSARRRKPADAGG